MITKRKYGTEASVLPSSKRELGRGKKKKKLNCPPNLRKSVESVDCVFFGKRKQYENRNFFPVFTSIGLSGTLISVLMIASLFHLFFFFGTWTYIIWPEIYSLVELGVFFI